MFSTVICFISTLTKRIIVIFLFSQMALALDTKNANNDNLHEVKTFIPRSENIKIKIENEQTDLNSIFSTLMIKNFIHSTEKIFNLLSWELQNHNIPEQPSYIRKFHFGGWVKNPKLKNCYNTRSLVLQRDSLKPVVFKENNCTVAEGEWFDLYTEETITDAQQMQIDHMVPLKDAYISGAYAWSFKARCLYGNYMGYKNHLISAYGEENNNKGDQTPENYMPPKDKYKCTYLKDWLFIKAVWGLTMSTEESNEIKLLITKHNCDESTFTLSQKELNQQYSYISDNKNLCPEQYIDSN